MTFQDAVVFILEAEGEYSNDKADPGGETRYGISKRSYPQIDMTTLTKEGATEIYRRDFWDKCKCSELPHGLDLLVFDAAVNQGPVAAARMLQDALKVSSDGIIGAITIRAAHNAADIIPEYLARRAYQYCIVPQVIRFGLGWFRRLGRAAKLALQSPA